MEPEKIFIYSSYIVSLATAYYTLVIRIVRLEAKTENFDKLIEKLEKDLSEIKKEIKEINGKLK